MWIRATLPQDASYDAGAKMAHEIREILQQYPVVTQVVSQMGRPDDGTDVTTFNNVEFMVSLKNPERLAQRTHQRWFGRANERATREVSRHRFQFLAEYSGQRRGGHVRGQGRKFHQAFR